jgi:alkylation response protein AidB-like acyl-CoA dehydrogenase
MGRPAHPELLAACRELTDQIRQPTVVGVAPSLGAQDGDRVVGDGLPVDEELRRARVEEQEPGRVRRLHRIVGLAADLHRFGHPFGARILSWVADGEVLASGHAETGNEVPRALSTTRAERVQGGWRLHGRKLFGSLGPVWDRIGVHAMDATSPTGPVVVPASSAATRQG